MFEAIKKVHHIAISVRSLEVTAVFYKTHFGFQEVKRFERPDLKSKFIHLALGDTFIELWEFDGQIPNADDFSNLNILGYKHLALEVDNIQELYEQFKAQGVEITEPKTGSSGFTYSFLKDPDGLPIELIKVPSE